MQTVGSPGRGNSGAVPFSVSRNRLAVAGEGGRVGIGVIETGELDVQQAGLFLPPLPAQLRWVYGAVGTVWLTIWWRIRPRRRALDGMITPLKVRRGHMVLLTPLTDCGWHLVLWSAILVVGNGLALLS